MNNSFSLQQIQKTSNLDGNLISRQYKLNLMADFMRNKYENPKLKQSEIANSLGYSSSIQQRYRNDVNMVSPYRIQPNNSKRRTKKTSNTNFDIDKHREHDVKRPQITSNDLKTTQTYEKNKSILKAGSVHEDIENKDQYFEKSLENKDI